MRYALLSFLLIFGVSSLKAQIVPRDNPMTPADPAYADARNFADVLDQSGIKVLAISPSKYNGFFRGVEKAAYYRTDKGIFEVIFFPDATAADKLAVHETRNGNRYLYSFTGQPHPRTPGDTIDSAKQMRFITYGNLFILVWGDDELYEALKTSLT